jgi:hypothetical protein
LSISGTVEYIGAPTYAVDKGSNLYFHQYVSNGGYAAGGTYARLYVPSGFTVEGVRVYTNDNTSHFYNDTDIYHIAGSSYWRVALGATIAGYTRHLRWFLRANTTAACGTHDFQNQAYFQDAGINTGSPASWDTVTVTCYTYLPLARR